MSSLREEIEAYLATFREGADQQRYHLENFMRWREATPRPAPTHKRLIYLARAHGRVRNHPSFGYELIFSPKGLAALIEAVTAPKDESPAYRPSGLMCYVCARRDADCSNLDFASMRRIKTDRDGVTVVKCNQFKKEIGNEKQANPH